MDYDTGKVKFTETGRYGVLPDDEDDVYTVSEFKKFCKCGAFINYDGFGYPVKDGFADFNFFVRPSQIEEIPEDCTHIVWLNN